ncbi:MAG TPA: porin family protein [Desulfuromonadaceae bacterium]|jgi:outer membrane protein
MLKIIIMTIAALLLTVASALADSIADRLGVTAKIGATLPLNNDFIKGTSDTKAGIAVGGGLIYGFTEHVAADVEALHMPQLDVQANGVKTYEAAITDVALGVQFRFLNGNRLVPYFGLGPDFITADLKHVNGASYKLDWTYGGHVNLGFDWFITPGIAMTTDVRGVYAIDGDVMSGSTKVSEYRPQWFQGTVGFRLMLPKNWWM